MSYIDDLIAECCPGGVPFSELSDIARTLPGLSGKTKADFLDGDAHFVTYKNVFANLAVDQSAQDLVKVGPHERQNTLCRGDVVITGSSESLEDVGMSSVVLDSPDKPLYLNSFCFIVRFEDPSIFIPGFSKYLFRAESVRSQIRRTASGVTRINISKPRFMKVRVPVPPLEVQREIVRILDQFTQLEVELEAELESELEARGQRYMHCRSELLSFDSNTHWVQLSDVVDYTNGKAHEKLADPSGRVAMVTARFISRNGEANRFVHLDDVLTPAVVGDVAMVLSDLPNGRALARTFFVDKDASYAINQRVARLRVKDPTLTNPKFVYHFLDRCPGLLRHDNGIDQTHLSKSQVTGLRFPLLSADEQERIVGILDRLRALVSDISVSLPAEVAARRKQYEYYRDKLLTFEEARA